MQYTETSCLRNRSKLFSSVFVCLFSYWQSRLLRRALLRNGLSSSRQRATDMLQGEEVNWTGGGGLVLVAETAVAAESLLRKNMHSKRERQGENSSGVVFRSLFPCPSTYLPENYEGDRGHGRSTNSR